MSVNSYGFIYVLANLYMPDVYKVGMTTRSPRERAEEISRATGVPEQFDVLYYAEVRNPIAEERRVHERLDDYRLNLSREFFGADIELIIEAIKADSTIIFSEWGWGVGYKNSEPMQPILPSSEVIH